jgi:hypothetical protein
MRPVRRADGDPHRLANKAISTHADLLSQVQISASDAASAPSEISEIHIA